MIYTFKINLPGHLFVEQQIGGCQHYKKKQPGCKLGMVCAVYWENNICLKRKENKLSNKNQKQNFYVILLKSNPQHLVTYNESIWFSINDLKRIFSPKRVANVLQFCNTKSISYYRSLQDRFDQPPFLQDGLSEENNFVMRMKTNDTKTHLIAHQVEEFVPEIKDVFIDEPGLYILLSRLRRQNSLPMPEDFFKWIHEVVVAGIRTQNRFIAFNIMNNERNNGEQATSKEEKTIKIANRIRDKKVKVTRTQQESKPRKKYKNGKALKRLKRVVRCQPSANARQVRRACPKRVVCRQPKNARKENTAAHDNDIGASLAGSEEDLIIVEEQDKETNDDIMIIKVMDHQHRDDVVLIKDATPLLQEKASELFKSPIIEDFSAILARSESINEKDIEKNLPKERMENVSVNEQEEKNNDCPFVSIEKLFDDEVSMKRFCPLNCDCLLDFDEFIDTYFAREEADIGNDERLAVDLDIVMDVISDDMYGTEESASNALQLNVNGIDKTTNTINPKPDEVIIKNGQYDHDQLMRVCSVSEPGTLYLIKCNEPANAFRLIVVHTIFSDEIDAIKQLYDGVDFSGEQVARSWMLEGVDFSFYLYDYLLKEINKLAICMKINEYTFFCHDYDRLIAMIEEIIWERKLIYFI